MLHKYIIILKRTNENVNIHVDYDDGELWRHQSINNLPSMFRDEIRLNITISELLAFLTKPEVVLVASWRR